MRRTVFANEVGETAKTLDDCLCGANCQESSETVNRGYFLKRMCISTDADHEISQSGTNTRLLRTPGSVGIRGIRGDPWGSVGIRGDPWGSVGIHGDPWGSVGIREI